MTSMPQQNVPAQQTPNVLSAPRSSGFWNVSPATGHDADLAVILAAAFHRGLTPTPPRKNLPVHVTF